MDELRDYQVDASKRIAETRKRSTGFVTECVPRGIVESLHTQRLGRSFRNGPFVEYTPYDGSPLLRFDVRCAVASALSKTYAGDWHSAPVVVSVWGSMP